MSHNQKLNKNSVWVKEWIKFYKEIFGLAINVSNIFIPPKIKGFNRPMIIAREIGDSPLEMTMVTCQRLFSYISYIGDNPDELISVTNRNPRYKGSYAIRVRDGIEADEENKNLSADDIRSQSMITMTLLERIILELFYFWKTGQHLDNQHWTLCSGPRNKAGQIPCCYWYKNIFWIFWYNSANAIGDFRARSVIV
ncbi:MAG: hypothetical protein COU29_02280 [Candidatus Magasanikbacteria bacterium CG10_big_fil_rev_8_21_14_0_10_36_32]|uniref:Uncharacterized protein n=1 Tax=Candidatus Magasanikbacteria bacterium CG10_big_fil_rev_8_21_14_0_10_36_32 TaxID=1974646 RepID=A0A2M6W6Z8_9BACT|nr:MAG: hypothetical protein COU29_02280 [Candidatus Magasanikbacteria bacterium CG10_big_fil_rev_8_21_14_0_10_36_32]